MEMERLYYKEPYKNVHEAKVLSVNKKDDYYEIILDDTIFYPEGGGQISDIGIIGSAEVFDVKEVDGEVVHKTKEPLNEGEVYLTKINWIRRFSNMQHHTGEHIFSGIVKELYNGVNVGFHLGEDSTTMDYDIFLDDEDVKKIERLSNQAVYSNLPIKTQYYDGTPDIDYRSKIDLEGTVRIIEIPGYDTCACCGTHTKTTGEVGMIKVVNHHRYKGGSRLYMVCGEKALMDYTTKQDNIKTISNLLSVKDEDAGEATLNLYEERNNLRGEVANLKEEINKMMAEKIEKSDKICLFLDNYDMSELIKFSNFIMEKSPFIALFSKNDEDKYYYFIYAKDRDMREIAKDINSNLNGKGGGKDFISGILDSTQEEISEYINNI